MGHSEEDEALLDAEMDTPRFLLRDRIKNGRSRTITAAVAVAAAITAVLFVLYGYKTFHGSTTTPYMSPTCGRAAAIARAKGCHYEPMLRSWIPHECYTPEPGDEYSPFDDRAWFYDKNLTQPMVGSDLDVLRNGDDITAYTKFFHDEHCLYAWRKLALAVEKRLPLVDSKTMSLHHSTHCSKRIALFIQEAHTYVWNDSHTGTAPLMFQTCVPLFL
jgi:hypothetical protein